MKINKFIDRISKPEVLVKMINNSPLGSPESLKGKVALITGGSRGIGKAVAQSLYDAGASVVLIGRDESHLTAVLETMPDSNRTLTISWDVSDLNGMNNMLEKTYQKFLHIDILVNCAGITGKLPADANPFFDETEENFDRVMNTNLKSVYFLSQQIGKQMIEEHIFGYIINIASMVGQRPAFNPYHLSKWGITGFTKGLAKILAPHGIIVNGIAPGVVTTDMMDFRSEDNLFREDTPDRRWARPEDIANIVLFFVSGYGNHIVGEIITCDGGFLLN